MDKFDKVLFGILVLSFIIFISALIIDIANYNLEAPFSINSLTGDLTPADRVKENQIKVYEDRVVIEIPNAKWAKFAPTDSMTPFLNENSNAIQIIPENEDQIEVGDIVSYESFAGQTRGLIIIHRIIEKNIDEEGVYFIAKGDNNLQPDPEKIRFNQIKRVLVGVIY